MNENLSGRQENCGFPVSAEANRALGLTPRGHTPALTSAAPGCRTLTEMHKSIFLSC